MSVWLVSVQGRLKERAAYHMYLATARGFKGRWRFSSLLWSRRSRTALHEEKERGIRVVMLGSDAASKAWNEVLDFEISSSSVGGGAK